MATIEIRDVLDNETGKTIFPRTHVDAVIGLKDFSFFEKVQDTNDPTKFSVKLKSEFTGLWAEGWIAAGGVGEGGGGGGASLLRQLEDVYHNENSILRADGNAAQPGDTIVYNDQLGWVAAPITVSGVVKKIACGSYNNLTPDANGLVSITTAVTAQVRWYVNENIIITRHLTTGTLIASIQLGGYNSPAVQIYAPSGGGGSGSTVTVSPLLYSGTAIAEITVDGSVTTLYAPAGGGGASVIDDLTDVSITGVSNGQILVYRDGFWVNETMSPATGISLGDLDNVAISGPSNGQALVYREGYWVNETIPGGGGGGSGTVTRIGMVVPGGMSVTPAQITSAGTFTITWDNQAKNKVFASPANGTGVPSFRALVAADLPDLSDKYVTLETIQNNISGKKTFTGGLAVDGGSYLDIGDARLVWDATNHALHITKRPGSSYTGDIGVYAEGFVASGATGQSS